MLKITDITNTSLNLAEAKFYKVGIAPPCFLSFANFKSRRHLNDERQLIKVRCQIKLLFLAYTNQTSGKRLEALTCRTKASRVHYKSLYIPHPFPTKQQ